MSVLGQKGQALTDCLLVLLLVALTASAGFALIGDSTSGQAAGIASSLAGNVNSTNQNQQPAQASNSSLADYASGFVNGIYQNLLQELSLFATPLETLTALFELGQLLANDLTGTAQQLVDSLLLKPLDTLVNGSAYEQGYVVGQHISPTQALSTVSKLAAVAAVIAPAKRISKQVVLGSGRSFDGFPNYIDRANELGARYFHVPVNIWSKLTKDQRIAANLKFIDRAIERGDEIILSTPIQYAGKNTHYDLELKHLRSKGYTFSDDGLRAIPPKAKASVRANQ